MIQKPVNYTTSVAFDGETMALPAGGYVCKIIKATQQTSKAGSPMLILLLDIAEGEYAGYYRKSYDNDTREDKKWGCTYRQLLTEKSASFLKGLVTIIEKSNNFTWDWNEQTLMGKLVGMIFGKEQYTKPDGTLAFSTKPLSPKNVDKIRSGTFEVPADKLSNTSSAGFMASVVTSDDDDLPF